MKRKPDGARNVRGSGPSSAAESPLLGRVRDHAPLTVTASSIGPGTGRQSSSAGSSEAVGESVVVGSSVGPAVVLDGSLGVGVGSLGSGSPLQAVRASASRRTGQARERTQTPMFWCGWAWLPR